MLDKTMELALIVSAVDHASAIFNRIKSGVAGLDAQFKKIGSGGAKSLQAVGAIGSSLGKGLFAGGAVAAAAVGFHAVAQEAAQLDTELMRIVNTGELSIDKFAGMRKELTALSGQVGVSRGELAAGLGDFVAGGLDPEKAMKLLPQVGKAYSTYGGQILDYTKAIDTGVKALGIEDPTQILETMIRAGKEGKVEVADQAGMLPALGARYKGLGHVGRPALASIAAGLQAIRRNTGSAEEAATNFQNLLDKLHAPDVVRNFQKVGLASPGDIWKKAAAAGRDPLSELARTLKAAGFDSLEKLAPVVVDRQAQQGLLAIMQNLEFYEATLAQGLSASGQLAKDSANIEKTFGFQLKQLKANFMAIADTALAPWLERLNGLMKWLNQNTWAVRAGVSAIMLALVGGPVVSGVSKLAGLIGTLSRVGGIVGHFGVASGLSRILSAGGASGLAGIASKLPALLPLLGPIALKLALIAGAAMLVYNAFKPLFDGIATGFLQEWQSEWEALQPTFSELGDQVKSLLREVVGLFATIFGGNEAWGDFNDGMAVGAFLAKALGTAIMVVAKGIGFVVYGLRVVVGVVKMFAVQAMDAFTRPFKVLGEMIGTFEMARAGGDSIATSLKKAGKAGMLLDEQLGDLAKGKMEKALEDLGKGVPKVVGDAAPAAPALPGQAGAGGRPRTIPAPPAPGKATVTHQGDIMPITVQVNGGGADAKKTADEVVAAVRARARDLVPILEQAGLVLARKQA
jgi:TP901 family phage tail tape measure protein